MTKQRVWIASAGWRGDYEILGVYTAKEMADAKAKAYNDETGYAAPSGNEAAVREYLVEPAIEPEVPQWLAGPFRMACKHCDEHFGEVALSMSVNPGATITCNKCQQVTTAAEMYAAHLNRTPITDGMCVHLLDPATCPECNAPNRSGDA